MSFEKFWETWPKGTGRKRNKAGCQKKWRAKNLDAQAQTIIEDVQWRAKYHKPWLDGYVPMPMTYLNAEDWNAERVDVRDKKTPSAPAQRPKEPLPDMSKWAIAANRILMKQVCRQPLGNKLQHALAMKRQIVEEAERDDAAGEPWDGEEFVSVVENGIRQAVESS